MSDSNDLNMMTPSLWQRYKNLFPIGAAISPGALHTHRDLLVKHFNSLTCENHMKPVMIQPQEGKFAFETADSILDFAKENKMLMRGHTLVWHNQTPDWFFEDNGRAADRNLVLNRMKSHINTVVSHYKGSVYCWDVVNEAIDDKDDGYLRESKWLGSLGEGFIAEAFRAAHEADPDAALFYNDYNAVIPQKRDKIYRLLAGLKEKDVPVHGMGIQGHWNIYDTKAEDIRNAIEKYSSLGIDVQITELDVSCYHWNEPSGLQSPTDEMMKLQEKKYGEIFEIFREYSDVISGITFWGPSDEVSWLNNFPVRGRKNWPLLFDTNQRPKGSFWRVADFCW